MKPVILYTEKEKPIVGPVMWALAQSQTSGVNLRDEVLLIQTWCLSPEVMLVHCRASVSRLTYALPSLEVWDETLKRGRGGLTSQTSRVPKPHQSNHRCTGVSPHIPGVPAGSTWGMQGCHVKGTPWPRCHLLTCLKKNQIIHTLPGGFPQPLSTSVSGAQPTTFLCSHSLLAWSRHRASDLNSNLRCLWQSVPGNWIHWSHYSQLWVYGHMWKAMQSGSYRPGCRIHCPEGHRYVYPQAKANKTVRACILKGQRQHRKQICTYPRCGEWLRRHVSGSACMCVFACTQVTLWWVFWVPGIGVLFGAEPQITR